uniref:Carotenoid cleavage dioxygenase chloroplastic n=1 Tax=Bixa orellana TaxID=66672 RepID=A0A9Y0ZEQ9_BIXOR|nr:putative carotenoid cleavage dioxygenase chloroplastic [Bixa orellana]
MSENLMEVVKPKMKSYVWLQTSDGSIQQVEEEVAMFCPLICQEIHEKGVGSSKNYAISLPEQVNPAMLGLILDYCRFHQVPGRSNKERKTFDEKFIRIDTDRLCDLTSAANSLKLKPLVDLTSRALARIIEGKTPEEIRETFNIPDDLTEEEKLEPLKNITDDPHIRLLNRLYARKRKELKERAKQKNVEVEEGQVDERSVDDLLSFINGRDQESKGAKTTKNKKKNRRRKEQQKDSSNNLEENSKKEFNTTPAACNKGADDSVLVPCSTNTSKLQDSAPSSISRNLEFAHLKISSVKIEEKPQTSTTTKTPPQYPKAKTPPPPPTPLPAKAAASPSFGAQRRAEPTIPTLIFNVFDDIINNFVDPPIRPSVDPRHVLSHNFAPVDELPPTECDVIQGTLPPCLDGAYIRNGPNPQFLPRGPYHLFDGDGMLHAIRISQGRATLCSRYVKTYKYTTESDAGAPLFPNVFSGFNGLTASGARGALAAARILSGQFNPANGIGLANTSVAFFGGRLYALGESDLPYTIRLASSGDIETLGRHDFNGKLFMSMTAHPKIDPETGEAFAFRYGPVPPFLTYFHFDKDGNKQPDVPIFSMVRPSFLHDFAITKSYAIFADIQIGMNPMEMIFGGGSPVGADPAKVPRIGIIPRYAKDESEMKWFDVPGFNLIHTINAWEEDDGDALVMLAPNILSVEHTLERMELVHALVEKVKINLKTGIVTRQPLSARNLDFAVINPAYVAKRNKYVYAAIGDPMPKISGVVKLDVSQGEHRECTVASRIYGQGCYGGEPFFVAAEPGNPEAAEDDGYVVSYVHNENTGESRFLVMDAKSPDLDIVAAVKLPRRVPYGFHGLFVSESDLNKL